MVIFVLQIPNKWLVALDMELFENRVYLERAMDFNSEYKTWLQSHIFEEKKLSI